MFMKNSNYIIILVILFITLVIGEIISPSYNISNEEFAKNQALKRSVLIEWENSRWSGVLLSSQLPDAKILTIIHEDSMKKINESENKELKVSFEDNDSYSASLEKWDSCNELSILTIKEYIGFNLSYPKIGNKSKISEKLFSFGHPLGLNYHYTEGYVNSKNLKLKTCGMITDGFSGGTIPGQTGSGLWNLNAELYGLIIATSAYKVKSYDEEENVIGASAIPITFLGRYVPSNYIQEFIK